MEFKLRDYRDGDLSRAALIWNEIIEDGESFPGDQALTEQQIADMLRQQTVTRCVVENDEVVGYYVLHPNSFGRCGHIANASYCVKRTHKGRGIGSLLVADSVEQAKVSGFLGLQFNAVVSCNVRAVSLYLKHGFSIVGTIKNGFRYKDEGYRDTLVFLKTW